MKGFNPFIQLIKSPYNFYMYEVNTNTIIPISEGLFKYLKRYHNDSDIIPESYVEEEIQELIQQGLLCSERPSNIEDERTQELEYFLSNRLSQLILQVTQQCNFRCSYCAFTYSDNTLNRTHSDKTMSWETAKRAIDFFSERVRDSKEVTIAFYGGEPLLEYELIQKVIEYSEKVLEGKALKFAMTTNATLLTPDKLYYLVKHKANIMVSLDGPKEIHNKGRKFASDGRGTFDSVYNNLVRLRNECPEEYKDLMFNCVVDPLSDDRLVEAFFENDIFSETEVNVAILFPKIGTGIEYTEEFGKYYTKNQLLAFLKLQGFVSQEQLGILAKDQVSGLKKRLKNLTPKEGVKDTMNHGGPCLAGEHRLFVQVDGKFFPCEKTSEISEDMTIGNISEGFELSKIKKQVNVGKLTSEKCKNCWAIWHCTICAHQANNGTELSKDMISSLCRDVKSNLEADLKKLIALQETNSVISKYIYDN